MMTGAERTNASILSRASAASGTGVLPFLRRDLGANPLDRPPLDEAAVKHLVLVRHQVPAEVLANLLATRLAQTFNKSEITFKHSNRVAQLRIVPPGRATASAIIPLEHL